MNIRQRLLAWVRDEPGMVDLRGLLESGRAQLFCNVEPTSGLVARSIDFPYAIAAGEPEPDVVRLAAEVVDGSGTAWAGEGTDGEWHLLAGEATTVAVARALPAWPRRGVTLHRRVSLPGPANDDAGLELRVALEGHGAAGWDLGDLPEALRTELDLSWVRSRPIAALFLDAQPVSFCYAPLETAGFWDVAVDTLPEFRRRGLAAKCFEALAVQLADRGLAPVWGALDDNQASMRLAARLGFEPCRSLTSFVRPPLSQRPAVGPSTL